MSQKHSLGRLCLRLQPSGRRNWMMHKRRLYRKPPCLPQSHPKRSGPGLDPEVVAKFMTLRWFRAVRQSTARHIGRSSQKALDPESVCISGLGSVPLLVATCSPLQDIEYVDVPNADPTSEVNVLNVCISESGGLVKPKPKALSSSLPGLTEATGQGNEDKGGSMVSPLAAALL